ncbi:hypothetical protein CRM22_000636 [Opisthorchis felineus]|nr:hypothetical protein CRM22_000636 [Opisthorchis felineus]
MPATVLESLRGSSYPSTTHFIDIQHLVPSGDDKLDDKAVQFTLSRVNQPNSANTIRRPLEISAGNSGGKCSKPTLSPFFRKNIPKGPVKTLDFMSTEPAPASAYKKWIRQKNTAEGEQKKTDMQQRIRAEQERKQREIEIQKRLSSWLRAKSLQRIRENELKDFQETERLYFTERSSKQQCEKAYKDCS